MDNDDQQLGRILSRREVLALLGAASAAALAACGPGQGTATPAATATALPTTAEAATATALPGNPTAAAQQQGQAATAAAANTSVATAAAATGATAVPACVVRPEVTEGPYYVDEDLNRSDIRSDPGTGAVKAGVPLTLTFNVSRVGGGCTPLQGAKVEVWHCDATGVYSDVADPGFNTKGQKFLRGYQMTDASGKATFTTIYPGWYRGRAVHIHFKVHPDANAGFTSQLFFDDALSDQVFAQAPYAGRGQRDTRNGRDGIYKEQLLLTVNKSGQGYAATFDIGIQQS